MSEEVKIKISNFIDSIIENKIDLMSIDIWTDKAIRHTYYSFDIITDILVKKKLVSYNLHFAVCPQSGLILLSKDNYDEFRENDIDFANKYAQILLEIKNRTSTNNLNLIIDSTCKELKLNRDENIKKLIG